MEHRLPQSGDRILVFKSEWIMRIMNGNKTLEIRGRRLRPGFYWIGSKGEGEGEGEGEGREGGRKREREKEKERERLYSRKR